MNFGSKGRCRENCNLYPCYRIKTKEMFTCKRYNKLVGRAKREFEIKIMSTILKTMDLTKCSDFFDSKGNDITKEGFFKNETTNQ